MPSKSTETSPRDIGLNVLPNFNVFGRLLSHASVYTDVVVNDVTNGYGATHIQLLTDLLHVRNIVYRSLNEQARQKLMRGEEVFINLICPAGYEFAVGFLAILALGAVVVPLGEFPNLPVHTLSI
jgi:malonyl-CoA/methylmalonyl-CoA synthetase